MLNSNNNDDNDELKWELVDGENEEENRGNIVLSWKTILH